MARDVLLMFGDISLATKNTAVYSADSLDTNTPAVKYTGRTANVNVVFSPKAAFVSTDGYVPIVQDSADGNKGSTIRASNSGVSPQISACRGYSRIQ